MYARLLIVLFVLFGTGITCLAQQPFYINYQTKEGLFSHYTYYVYQDKRGYMWTASDVGVSRFDGNTFTHFNTGHGLSCNEVFSMLEDRHERLWFATLNGKPCFYHKGLIYSEKNLPLLRQCQMEGLVFRLLERRDGSIVMASAAKIIAIDIETSQVEVLASGSTSILDIWENADGSISWYDRQRIYTTGRNPIELAGLPVFNKPFRALAIGYTLIFTSMQSIYLCDLASRRLLQQFSPAPAGEHIISLKYQNGLLWVGTRKGMYTYSYPDFQLQAKYLPDMSVSSFCEDREGGWWFSTLEAGLFYAPAPAILHYDTSQGLLFDRIYCLSRDASNRLWIGSEGSTFSILENKKLRTRRVISDAPKYVSILSIRHFPGNRTWVSGLGGTLMIDGKREQYLYNRSADVNIDVEGNYWIGLTGLYRVQHDQASQTITSTRFLNMAGVAERFKYSAARRLSNLRVNKIEFDASSRIWLATSTGLYVGLDSTHYSPVLPYVTRDILMDSARQVMWVLTETDGLFVLQNGRVIDSLRLANSRGDVICQDVCSDEKGNIWVGGLGGLFNVSGMPGHWQLTSYWGVYGLEREKINAIEVLNGEVYLGKDDGLLVIPENVLTRSIPAPPIRISSVQIGRKPQDFDNKEVEMAYGSEPLVVEFEGLSFREAPNIRYRYRLSGFDDHWHETALKSVEFAALRPGHYVLEVFSTNASGNLSAQPATLRFHVAPPFWLSAWFVVVVLALLALAAVAYIRWREARLHHSYDVERRLMDSSRENAELQQRNTELRMLSLRLQMNPHFIFNALNTIKGYYGQEKFVEANAFIGRFARLLRINLDYSDALIPLDRELELLQIYVQLSQTRYPDKITLDLQVSPELRAADILIPSMLIQPFVENAVIHGLVPRPKGGLVSIKFDLNNTEIKVHIRDNGIGRSAASLMRLQSEHKHLATQITTERLQLLKPEQSAPAVLIQDLYDEQGVAAGTAVTLFIPFQKNHHHDQRDPH